MDKRLINYTARLFGIEPEHIISPIHRRREVVAARSALIWALMNVHPSWTMSEVGRHIGIADRGTVSDAYDRAESLRQIDRSYQAKLDKLLLVANREEVLPPPPPARQRPEPRPPFQPDALARWAVQLQGGTYIYARTA